MTLLAQSKTNKDTHLSTSANSSLSKVKLYSLDEQLMKWKDIFIYLMSHKSVLNNSLLPQHISLSDMSPEIAEEYAIVLRQFYSFVEIAVQTEEQNRLLIDFFNEDNDLITSGQMTHEAFIFSTFRLSILMDRPAILANTIVEPELHELINSGSWRNLQFYHDTFSPRVFRFPDPPMSLVAPIYLPEGELPISSFLDAFLTEDFPYGLAVIPLDPTFVHGGTMGAPALFYSHDLLHWPVFGKLVNKSPQRWPKLREALRYLYINNKLQDPTLNYFIFMILHEGALADEFPKLEDNSDVIADALYLLEQIPSEMDNRFNYHRSFLKNFFLAKLQAVLSQPHKLYRVDEIDEQKLDVLSYERSSPTSYSVKAALLGQGTTKAEFNCKVTITHTSDPYFSECSISEINMTFIVPELSGQKNDIIQKLLGSVLVKNPRYFFYIDVKDHLKTFKRLTKFPDEKDPYPQFLPWVQSEVNRLITENNLRY